jgi:hypothetical protein
MIIPLAAFLVAVRSIVRSRFDLQLENLALRHQINVLRRSAKTRVKLTSGDRRGSLLPPCYAGRGKTYRTVRLAPCPRSGCFKILSPASSSIAAFITVQQRGIR